MLRLWSAALLDPTEDNSSESRALEASLFFKKAPADINSRIEKNFELSYPYDVIFLNTDIKRIQRLFMKEKMQERFQPSSLVTSNPRSYPPVLFPPCAFCNISFIKARQSAQPCRGLVCDLVVIEPLMLIILRFHN